MAECSASTVVNNETAQNNQHRAIRIVLTGGPGGGKTSGQIKLASFFNGVKDWKVFLVPDKIGELSRIASDAIGLSKEDEYNTKCKLIKAIMAEEDYYFHMAEINCQAGGTSVVICDRCLMDATIDITPLNWKQMQTDVLFMDETQLRESRYDLIIHLATPSAEAGGHKEHLTNSKTSVIENSIKTVWQGHTEFHIIPSNIDFTQKVTEIIATACEMLAISYCQKPVAKTRKRKFKVQLNVEEMEKQTHRVYFVVHDYLSSNDSETGRTEVRIRKKREIQQGEIDRDCLENTTTDKTSWMYSRTVRKCGNGETLSGITASEYESYCHMRNPDHGTIFKRRYYFDWNEQYFHLDIFTDKCPSRCQNLILLETYTTNEGELDLPPFITSNEEVTDNKEYSMFYLSENKN